MGKRNQQKGTGDHLHDVIQEWIGEDFELGCGCEKWVRKMNRGGVQWTRGHFDLIVQKLHRAASQRGWWKVFKRLPKRKLLRISVRHPQFIAAPVRSMINEAIRRSES